MTALEQVKELKTRMQAAIIGQDDVVQKLLIALLANGNVLLEGMPGLAKTRAVRSLARNLDCKLSRIQFTPDLLPADITGTEIYQPENTEKFIFQPGPIFSNLVLADEINRAPAKVQSALLEAMEERQVSVSGKTHNMEPLFMVLATENPIEQEGTYPLPEAQLDRFLMKIKIDYPAYNDELKIVRLVRDESREASAMPNVKAPSVTGVADPEAIPQEMVFAARRAIDAVQVREPAERYIVDLVSATRNPEKISADLRKWISFGASPRGAIALDKCSRAVAWLDGRDYVTPDDIRYIVPEVLRHRILLGYAAGAAGITVEKVLEELVKNVAVT